jgi:hypothetical protein
MQLELGLVRAAPKLSCRQLMQLELGLVRPAPNPQGSLNELNSAGRSCPDSRPLTENPSAAKCASGEGDGASLPSDVVTHAFRDDECD